MALGQPLESLQRTDYFQEVGTGIEPLIILGHIDDDEIGDAPAIELRNVVMAVVALRAEREEERLFGKAEGTTVGEKKTNLCRGAAETVGADERCYLLNG